MELSKNISNTRISKGLTQLEIAVKLGMEQSNYARLEGRGEKLTIEQLQKIAEALGVGIGDLMGTGGGEVKNSAREAELEKRVVELEDRVKDKTLIVTKIDTQYGNVFTYLNIFFAHKIIKCALENSILDVDENNEIMVFECKEANSKRWYNGYKHSYITKLDSLTDEQILKVLPMIDRDIDRLIDSAYAMNLLDTRLRNLYAEYSDKHGEGYFIIHL